MNGQAGGRNTMSSGALYAELTILLRDRLRPALKSLFDGVDDSLFDLTEHCRQGDQQQAYFDGMRECRKHRDAAQLRFFEAISEQVPAHTELRINRSDLSLLEHDDLELHLALTNMSNRAGQRLGEPLRTLTLGLATLIGWDDPNDDHNPLGPARLSEAFRDATAPINLSLEVRLILFKLFERHVLTVLEPIYAQLNDEIAKAGIVIGSLPDPTAREKRENPARNASAGQAPKAESDAASDAGSESAAAAARTAAALQERELLSLLMDLVALRQVKAPPVAPARGASREQRKRATADASAAPTLPPGLASAIERSARRVAEGGKLPPPRQFAAQLLAEARYARDGLETAPAQAATVDLVGRLFDAVLSDRQVPRPMQPVLHRLQAPVTRAALEDPRCLSDPNNPIRQAIDLLGEASLGWCPSADPEHRLLAQLRESIDTVASADSGDERARELGALTRLLETQQRRAELAEQRVVESATGRERLAFARRQVHHILAGKLARAPVPAWVRHLLSRPWANCLVLLWLRNGEDSDAYRDALEFVDGLLWCGASGGGSVEKLRLRALLPVLETQLRTGLATVAYHESEIDQMALELRGFIRYRLGEIEQPAFLDQEPPTTGRTEAMPVEPDIADEQPDPDDLDQALLDQLRQASPGTWFEFGAADSEQFERAKLSWISPYSGRYLFVNRNGMRVADRRPQEMVQELEQGLARILEGANLLQRALATVLEQIRPDSAASDGAGKARG